MSAVCPKCKNIIPNGNPRCNLCGFEYEKFLQEQKQKNNKINKKNNPTPIIISLIIFLFFSFFYYFINNLYVFYKFFPEDFLTPDNIFKIMNYFPIIIFLIVVIVIIFSIIVSVKSTKK